MKCPACGYKNSKVADSRPEADRVMRKRVCPQCGVRWSTEEVRTSATYKKGTLPNRGRRTGSRAPAKEDAAARAKEIARQIREARRFSDQLDQ